MLTHTGSRGRGFPAFHAWLLPAAVMLLLVAGTAAAGDMTQTGMPLSALDRDSGPLDGQVFIGEFGPIGKPAKGTDKWIFSEGGFRSESCVECGFPENVYTSAAGSGGTHFSSTTGCPVSDAVIVWKGIVKDGEIDGVFTWTKKRWYRTITKKYWFKGKIEDSTVGKLE